MRNRLAEHGVSVELNSALTSIEQRDDGVIATVTACKNGELTEEESERISAQYVIGADGAKGENLTAHAIFRIPIRSLFFFI